MKYVASALPGIYKFTQHGIYRRPPPKILPNTPRMICRPTSRPIELAALFISCSPKLARRRP